MEPSVSFVFLVAELLEKAKLRCWSHNQLIDVCERAFDGGAKSPPEPGSWSSRFERRAGWGVMISIHFTQDAHGEDTGWDDRLSRIEEIVSRQPDYLELLVAGLLDPDLELYDDNLAYSLEGLLAQHFDLLPRYFAELERWLPLRPKAVKFMVQIATEAAARQQDEIAPESRELLKKWKRSTRVKK